MRYRVRQDFIVSEEGAVCPVYGIEAYSCSGRLLQSVPDIFCSRSRAETLAALCNAGKLALSHLPCVIEDALLWGSFLPEKGGN